jgi:hypothetical protein
MTFWMDKHGLAIAARGHLVALRPSRSREFWSERNRIGWRVIYLPRGWRLAWRTEPAASHQITAAFITPECRSNRGDDGAWQEAVDRLRAEYDAVLEGWRGEDQQPTLNLVLELERSRA